MKYDDVIDNLVDSHESVRSMMPAPLSVALWAAASYTTVLVLLLVSGDLRPGWPQQLTNEPMFLLEVLLGSLASPIAAWYAIKLSIPNDANYRSHGKWFAPVLVMGLLLLVLTSLAIPHLEPSMLGKRPTCIWETLVFGIIPALFLFPIVRRAAPLMPTWNALLVGVAAFMPTGIAMHIACMYDPVHILKFHLAPALFMTILTTLLGRFLLTNKSAKPL